MGTVSFVQILINTDWRAAPEPGRDGRWSYPVLPSVWVFLLVLRAICFYSPL